VKHLLGPVAGRNGKEFGFGRCCNVGKGKEFDGMKDKGIQFIGCDNTKKGNHANLLP
jgi:hypothetical protein